MKIHIRLMKTSAVAVALVAMLVAGAIWEVRRVRAIAPPVPESGLFGMVGITRGQTMRLNVVNLVPPSDPDSQIPPPCRVVLSFRNAQGQPFRNSDGQIIRRIVDLQAGESAFLDLNGDQVGGLDTNGPGRMQLRPFVHALHPPPDHDTDPCIPSAEVFDNATLRTSFLLPGVERMERPEGHNHNETLVRDLRNPEQQRSR